MKRVFLALTLFMPTACSFDPEESYPVRVVRAGESAQIQLSQVDSRILNRALELFKFDNGRYPTTQEGLQALVQNPGLQGWRQYVSNPVAIQGVRYESNGSTFKLSMDRPRR